ncbi:MAG: AAA family ATPase [Candidatus Omnitrophica bacterium]|nr:AAA family ATPase [Candidatus Omnitrophota bacterium]
MEKLSTLIIADNREQSDLLKRELVAVPDTILDIVISSSLSEAKPVLLKRPEIIFIEISEIAESGIDLVRRISLESPTSLLVAISKNDDADLILKAVRAGAKDFLKIPTTSSQLTPLIERAKRIESGAKPLKERMGKVVTVFSNKGGTGTTTLAINLAVALATLNEFSVVVVDLVLQHGDVSAFLDIAPTYTIVDIIENFERLDASFLKAALAKHSSGIYVLAEPLHPEEAELITTSQIGEILKLLRTMFDYVIVDGGNEFDEHVLSSLDLSDTILLLSLLNLPAIRNTKRCLDIFRRLRYDPEKARLIINRYDSHEIDKVSIESVEKALNYTVSWKLPNDYFSVISAINQGLPIFSIDRRSKLSQSILQLAGILADRQIPTQLIKREEGLLDKVKQIWKGGK